MGTVTLSPAINELRAAARWLWNEMGIGAELSGAAAVAARLARTTARCRKSEFVRSCAAPELMA